MARSVLQALRASGDHGHRRGIVVVLAALLMVAVFGFTAFTIDTGYVLVVQAQLQNAADAAALAGASVLADGPYAVYKAAQEVAAANSAAGKPVQLKPTDVVLGRFDLVKKTFVPTVVAANAVKVTARVVDENYFFAPVLGFDSFTTERDAIAMVNPRDIVFVVDLSGSMNDDTEPCWATKVITDKFGPQGFPTVATDLMQKVYDDFGFGPFPGPTVYLGENLGVAKNKYAYAEMTKDNGPLTKSTIPSKYRIKNSDSELVRKQKAYSWIIDTQIAAIMPEAKPTPDSSINYTYWEKYIDYIIYRTSVGQNSPSNGGGGNKGGGKKGGGSKGGGGGGGGGGGAPKPPSGFLWPQWPGLQDGPGIDVRPPEVGVAHAASGRRARSLFGAPAALPVLQALSASRGATARWRSAPPWSGSVAATSDTLGTELAIEDVFFARKKGGNNKGGNNKGGNNKGGNNKGGNNKGGNNKGGNNKGGNNKGGGNGGGGSGGSSMPGVPRNGSTKKVTLPPQQDSDRIDKFNNPNKYTFPSASSSLPKAYRNVIGYITYVQFMMDWGRDRSPDVSNSINADPGVGIKTPLSTLSPFVPYHAEATAGGTFTFPPRSQPMHAVRRALIAAINVVKEQNKGLSPNVSDWVGVVTFDALDAYHQPEVLVPLTADFKTAMQACTTMQAVSDIGTSTATEAGIIKAREILKPVSEGGQARSFTSKVMVLLTDGVPNAWQTPTNEISDYLTQNPNADFYDPAYVWYNAALRQAALFQGENGVLFPVGMGLGADYDFMDRMARFAKTAENGQSPRGSGNPAEYEQTLIDIFTEIIQSPGARLVE